MDRGFMFMKKMVSGDCLPLPWGYMRVYFHNIQTSLKPLGQSKPNFIESLYRKEYINNPGHMTKMAIMPIYCKNL
ncbi:MAG: hypothetical protein AB2693_34020 [Candidatus Thiodiazotropha sp.]